MAAKDFRRMAFGMRWEQSCASKHPYPSRRLAGRAAERLRMAKDERFQVYICRCGNYHVGHVIKGR